MVEEKIIFAPGTNETELLSSFAKSNMPTFGLRVVDGASLANMALERNGIILDRVFIPKNYTAAILYHLIKSDKEKYAYFDSILVNDAFDIIDSINELRMNILSLDELDKLHNGEFILKNVAVINLVKDLDAYLDKHKLIDTPKLIRYVLNNKDLKFDADIYVINAFPLKKLEKALLQKFNNGVEHVYPVVHQETKIGGYHSFYGEKAEAEYVFSYIKEHNLHLDECLVAVSNEKYRQIFEDIATKNNFPTTFGIGKSLCDTYPGKLFLQIKDWYQNFAYKDYLIKIFTSMYIDKETLAKDFHIDSSWLKDLAEMAGNLRLDFHTKKNEEKINHYFAFLNEGNSAFIASDDRRQIERNLLEACLAFNKILSCGIAGILKYAHIRETKKDIDIKALNSINSIVSLGREFHFPLDEVFDLMDLFLIDTQISKEGCLHVTSINKAKSIARKYLFVVGMSADLYPGAIKEDNIVLDIDYESLGIKDKSVMNLNEKKEDFRYLLKLHSNSIIQICYPYFSSDDLKNKNASSLLFEIFNEQNGGNKKLDDLIGNNKKKIIGVVEKHDYYSSHLTNAHYVAESYGKNELEKNSVAEKENTLNSYQVKGALDRNYSASNIDLFSKCQYRFYLEVLLHFDSGFIDDPNMVLTSSSLGNIIHDALQHLDKAAGTSLNSFTQTVSNMFDNYLITHIPVAPSLIEGARKELLQIATNAFDMASTNKKVVAEKDLYATHASGIKVHGLPDLVEEVGDALQIIDYKNKNSISHDENNVKSLGQILTYRFLVESNLKKDVICCEYRYLKQHLSINITKSKLQEYKEQYDVLLDKLKAAITSNVFEKNGDEECCKYCPHIGLCKKKRKDDEEE